MGEGLGVICMPVRPKAFQPRGVRTAQQVDRDRGSAVERGYDGRWREASRAFRRANPLCQYCEAGAFGPSRVSAATLTDHLYPHRRFAGLFWRTEWWVAACTACHSGPKQQAELAGRPALHRLAALLGRPAWEGEGQSLPPPPESTGD